MRTTLYYAPLSRSKSAFDQISVAPYAWRRVNEVSRDVPLHDLAKAINHDRRANVAATSHATDDLSITEEPKSSVARGLDTPENGDGEHLCRGIVVGLSTIRNQFPDQERIASAIHANGLLGFDVKRAVPATVESRGIEVGAESASPEKATGPRRQPTKLAA